MERVFALDSTHDYFALTPFVQTGLIMISIAPL